MSCSLTRLHGPLELCRAALQLKKPSFAGPHLFPLCHHYPSQDSVQCLGSPRPSHNSWTPRCGRLTYTAKASSVRSNYWPCSLCSVRLTCCGTLFATQGPAYLRCVSSILSCVSRMPSSPQGGFSRYVMNAMCTCEAGADFIAECLVDTRRAPHKGPRCATHHAQVLVATAASRLTSLQAETRKSCAATHGAVSSQPAHDRS